MAQEIKVRQQVKSQLLIDVCTSLLGRTTHEVREQLHTLALQETGETKVAEKESLAEGPAKGSPIQIDFIEEYFTGMDIPEGAVRWIIGIQDIHIECIFSQAPANENTCSSVNLKFIHNYEFEQVYTYLQSNSTPVKRESRIRRFLIHRYNLAGYESWIYHHTFQVRTLVQPGYIKDIADKYNICFQTIQNPESETTAILSDSVSSDIDVELLMNISTALFDLTIKETEAFFGELAKLYSTYKNYEMREYREEIDGSDGYITRVFTFPVFRIQCVFPCDSATSPICEAVSLLFAYRNDFREVRNYIGSKGVPHRERPKFQRWLIDRFHFPRYEQWLYGRSFILYTAEQPLSVNDQFYIYLSKE